MLHVSASPRMGGGGIKGKYGDFANEQLKSWEIVPPPQGREMMELVKMKNLQS